MHVLMYLYVYASMNVRMHICMPTYTKHERMRSVLKLICASLHTHIRTYITSHTRTSMHMPHDTA